MPGPQPRLHAGLEATERIPKDKDRAFSPDRALLGGTDFPL